MNIAPIQIPPETPLPNVVNVACPNAPQKSNFTWEHVKINKVCRKLVFDESKDSKESKASASEVIDQAAANGEKKAAVIPATSTASDDSLFNKYKQAFDDDGFVVG